MDVKITGNMIVADGGVARQFVKGKTFTVTERPKNADREIAPETFRRLKRAGAAEAVPTKAKGKAKADAEGTAEQVKQTEAGSGTAGSNSDTGAGEANDASNEAGKSDADKG